ncbi:MAG: DUF4446 family protein [Candidatus Nealsonbacteria bacterium]|nr:DUF4446 family protein [Candidatus Nealsonbacteria bacterium]
MFEFLKRTKKEPENVSEVLKELKVLEKSLSDVSSELEGLKKESRRHLKKIGFLRYNPFPGVGSDQSFSLTLLDENDDGILISSLFSREGNRVYAKTIEKGGSSHPLSEEEKESLKKAIENHA